MEERKRAPKSARIVSIVFMTIFFVSIVCLIMLGVFADSLYNVATGFGIAGFVLLAISMLVLLHPYYNLWKVFFVDVVFYKKKKPSNDNEAK